MAERKTYVSEMGSDEDMRMRMQPWDGPGKSGWVAWQVSCMSMKYFKDCKRAPTFEEVQLSLGNHIPQAQLRDGGIDINNFIIITPAGLKKNFDVAAQDFVDDMAEIVHDSSAS